MQHNNDVEALVHLYEDGWFSRRDLMKRLTRLTGSAAVATATIESLQLPAEAQTAACPVDVHVPEDAPDIDTAMVDFPGEAGTLFAYWTRTKPMPENPMAAILVIHEN